VFNYFVQVLVGQGEDGEKPRLKTVIANNFLERKKDSQGEGSQLHFQIDFQTKYDIMPSPLLHTYACIDFS
jgi:hypothetical protein